MENIKATKKRYMISKQTSYCEFKKALYLSLNVFSTKVLIGDTIFTSPTGDGTAILRGHPSHAKVRPAACRVKGAPSFSSVILRP